MGSCSECGETQLAKFASCRKCRTPRCDGVLRYVEGNLQNNQDADGCLVVRRLSPEHGGVRSPPEDRGKYEQVYVRQDSRLADEAAAVDLEAPWLHPTLPTRSH